MKLYNIEIDRLTCENLSKAKSLEKFFEEHKFECAMQYDDRYLVDKEIQQKFYINDIERNGRFIPKFLIDLDRFPIHVIALDSLYSTHEAIKLLTQEGITYQIYDLHGSPVRENKLKDFFVVMRVETEEALFNIFNRYLYYLAQINCFVGFWLNELPCFSFHGMNSIKGRLLHSKEPMILVGMKHFMVSVDYDTVGIEIHDKNGMWSYEKWKRQLASFSISQYTETGYSCCDED